MTTNEDAKSTKPMVENALRSACVASRPPGDMPPCANLVPTLILYGEYVTVNMLRPSGLSG
jgi:hypothetical protein